jgi:hypothetical protein
MDATLAPRACRLARSRPIPFNCKLGAGHTGRCSVYTLPPLTREQWAALGWDSRYGGPLPRAPRLPGRAEQGALF